MAEDFFEQATRLGNLQMIRCDKKINILSNSERLDNAFLGILRAFSYDDDFLVHILDCRQQAQSSTLELKRLSECVFL